MAEAVTSTIGLGGRPRMTSLGLRSLETLRSLFLSESVNRKGEQVHVLVVYPRPSMAADANEREAGGIRTDPSPLPPRVETYSRSQDKCHAAAGWGPTATSVWRACMIGDDSATNSRLRDLARDAGRVLLPLFRDRPDVAAHLNIDCLVCMCKPIDLWFMALHELGRKPLLGSPLRWRQFTWDSTGEHEVGSWRASSRVRRRVARAWTSGTRRASDGGRPRYERVAILNRYYSIAQPNLLRASAFAVDSLLELFARPKVATARNEAAWQSWTMRQEAQDDECEIPTKPAAAPAPSEAKQRKRREKYWWVNDYVALTMQSPMRSMKSIAKELGVDPATIRRAAGKLDLLRKLSALRAAPSGRVRKGSFDAKTGNIEAEAPEDDD